MNRVICVIELVLRCGFCAVSILFALIGGYALVDSKKVVSITEVFAEDAIFEQEDTDSITAG